MTDKKWQPLTYSILNWNESDRFQLYNLNHTCISSIFRDEDRCEQTDAFEFWDHHSSMMGVPLLLVEQVTPLAPCVFLPRLVPPKAKLFGDQMKSIWPSKWRFIERIAPCDSFRSWNIRKWNTQRYVPRFTERDLLVNVYLHVWDADAFQRKNSTSEGINSLMGHKWSQLWNAVFWWMSQFSGEWVELVQMLNALLSMLVIYEFRLSPREQTCTAQNVCNVLRLMMIGCVWDKRDTQSNK